MQDFWEQLKEKGEVVIEDLGKLKVGKNGRIYLSSEDGLRDFVGKKIVVDPDQISFLEEKNDG